VPVRYAVVDNVAEIVLDRPEKLNALRAEDVLALGTYVDRAAEDGARAVLLRAEGRAFCVGRDLATMQDDEDPVAVLRETFNALVLKVRACPVPTVAAVQGACVGGGTGLALACDLVVAATSASFASPFGRLGGVPDCGFHWFVTTRLGPALAKDMVLTGRALSGSEAARLGLVARAVAEEDLLREARALVRNLAVGPTTAFCLSMPLVDGIAAGMGLEECLEAEAVAQGVAVATADFREGKAAFLGKRAPQFSGR
jgi:enoyl-CoA hydratase/carnithine racemase